jgi:hypothetical protein
MDFFSLSVSTPTPQEKIISDDYGNERLAEHNFDATNVLCFMKAYTSVMGREKNNREEIRKHILFKYI